MPLTKLFNLSLESGVLPADWKLAEVVAIFKKGNKQQPSNYRPVSLTCILCKVLESFVRDAIQDHMEKLHLYSPCQHGFRKGKSCITQLLNVMNDFAHFTDNNIPFDTIYLDFQKAFDTVPHERLLMKLQAYGVTGELFEWVKSFLKERLQYVKVGGMKSSTCSVSSGIPQGSILGPILFLIFINDLPDCLKSVCHIFADDTKVYNSSNNDIILQNDIDELHKWSLKWQLHFNSSKCKCIHFGNGNPQNQYFFHNDHDSILIEKATEEKDLGVIFESNLKFDKHINSAVNKANQILGIIKRNFTFMDETIFLKLYKALVRPHLEYGQSVWYPHLKRQTQLIENVQRRATKLLKNIKNLSYKERLIHLNLPSLKYRRIRGDLIYVYNIFKNESNCPENILLTLAPKSHNTRGHPLKLFKKNVKNDSGKFSFSQRVTENWNNLSINTVKANNINKFKNLLDEELMIIKYEFD